MNGLNKGLLISLSILTAFSLLGAGCEEDSGGGASPPEVVITSHTDGETLAVSPVTISGTITSKKAVASASVIHNDTDVTDTLTVTYDQTSFSFQLVLAVGDNEVTVSVTNDAGNSGGATVNLVYVPVIGDVTPPSITFTSHSDGTAVAGNAGITVSGDLADESEIVSLLVSHNDTDVTAEADVGLSYTRTDFTFDITLTEGSNTIAVTAEDALGNAGTASITVTYSSGSGGTTDTIAPTVDITSHSDGATVASFSNTVRVSGTLLDAGTIASLAVAHNSTDVTSQVGPTFDQTSFYFNLAVVSGLNTIEVSATDAAGNTGSSSIGLTFNPLSLGVAITSHADGASVADSAVITVSGEIYNFESVTSVKALQEGVDITAGANMVNNLTTFSFDLFLVPGDNTIEVKVVGNGTDYASTTITLTNAIPVPAAPAQITASPGGAKVTVGWDAVGDATGYNLYWDTAAGVTPGNGTLVPDVTSPHVHGGLPDSTDYYYVVTGLNDGGEGAPTPEISATTYTLLPALNFPDNNLANCVTTAIANNNYVYVEEFTTISCYSKGISDLSGIEDLYALTNVGFSGNIISDLTPLSTLTGITSLDLNYSNNVTDLTPLSGLANLTYLHMSDQVNLVSLTGLEGLDSLYQVGFGSNNISDLTPLSNLASLKIVYVHDNNVSDISPLATLPSVTHIFMQNNTVTDMSSLAPLTQLYDLNLNGNGINSIASLPAFPNLDKLYLDNNNIGSLSGFPAMPKMTRLNLISNSITDVSPLAGFTSLDALYLGFNSIADVSPLGGLTGLYVLELNDNVITTGVTSLTGLTTANTIDFGGTGNEAITCADLTILENAVTATVTHPGGGCTP